MFYFVPFSAILIKKPIVNPSPSNPPRTEAQKIELLEKQLQWANLRIQALEERLRLELIRKYGPKSETLNDAQLLLLELEPGVSSAEVEAESQREPMPLGGLTLGEKAKQATPPSRTAGTSGGSAPG